ncbi:hypothetical protein BC940DRAFT_302399 [Gongronella butleri]|nr:hypothetical protein BC940DRAFT_302399 [Gongronella butleri]
MAPIIIHRFVNAGTAGKFKQAEHQVDALEPHQILIKIRASAICHTDVYYLEAPDACLGHEPVGDVVEIGKGVKNFKVGDYAGWSYLKYACLECAECVSGNDLYCHNRILFPGTDNMNGFADLAVIDSRFAYHIPKEIAPTDAGPLMCAGSTVFNALYSTNTSPTDRVAVVGVGGLGHLALQFANKWGTSVTAISTNDSKAPEAKSFGAQHVLNSSKFDDEAYLAAIDKFDLIINTSTADLNYDQYTKLLKPHGKFLLVGVPSKKLEMSGGPFLVNDLALRGCLVGGRDVVNKMLVFAARHGIKPKTEILPFTLEGLEEGMERCRQSKARYRVVLTNE